MIPLPRLNTNPVTSSQPPHKMKAARTRSVRGRVPRHAIPATSRINAAGSNHEIWVPNSAPNMRVSPVAPHRPPCPPPPPPPCLSPPAAAAAGLVAGESTEAVVSEHELQDAVVLRAADVRT